MRNDIRIFTANQDPDHPDVLNSHFKMYEFENNEGLVMIHSSIPYSLEKTRAELKKFMAREVYICITNAIRTENDNELLAKKYGWIDEGGKVARNSKHLTKFGGIAVDFFAYYYEGNKVILINPKITGNIARKHFDWVKDDYADNHVHADNRNKT